MPLDLPRVFVAPAATAIPLANKRRTRPTEEFEVTMWGEYSISWISRPKALIPEDSRPMV